MQKPDTSGTRDPGHQARGGQAAGWAKQPRARSICLAFGVASLIALFDQGVKCAVVRTWPVGYCQAVTSFLSLVHWRNTGAAWGMFQGFSLGLGVFSVLAVGALVLGFRFFTEYGPLRSFSWGLICGGIVGNAIDRMARGAVVDYLYFYYHSLGWPAFNIADAAISVGVTLFLLAAVIHDHPPCSIPSPQP